MLNGQVGIIAKLGLSPEQLGALFGRVLEQIKQPRDKAVALKAACRGATRTGTKGEVGCRLLPSHPPSLPYPLPPCLPYSLPDSLLDPLFYTPTARTHRRCLRGESVR